MSSKELDVDEFYDFSNQISQKDQEKLSRKFNLNTLVGVIDPNSKNLDQEVDLEDRKLWGRHIKVDKSGPTGNEGATKTTLYHKYLLVFWPRMSQFETLTMASFGVALDNLLERKEKICGDEMFVNDLKYLLNAMKLARDRKKLNFIDRKDGNDILAILSMVKDLSLAKLFIGGVMTHLFEDNSKAMVDLVKIFGYEKLNEPIKHLVLPELPMEQYNFRSTCKLIKVTHFFIFFGVGGILTVMEYYFLINFFLPILRQIFSVEFFY